MDNNQNPNENNNISDQQQPQPDVNQSAAAQQPSQPGIEQPAVTSQPINQAVPSEAQAYEPVISNGINGEIYVNPEMQNGGSNPGASTVKKNDGLAIAAMILGIVSIVFSTVCCCCVFPVYVAPAVGIAGIICAAISKSKNGSFSNMALAGLICGIIGIVASIAMIIIIVLGGLTAEVTKDFSNFDMSEIEDYFKM